jgi:hypothetical protein
LAATLRPRQAQVYNWRIYVFAIVASFGALTFVGTLNNALVNKGLPNADQGYDGAFFGTTLARSSFQEVHHMQWREIAY